MVFDLSVNSFDIANPVHEFLGDEAFDLSTYRRAIYSGYLSSVSTMCGSAKSCGLELDTETFERWKRSGAAAGLLDDFLDKAPSLSEACAKYQDGLNRAFDIDETEKPPEWADPRLDSAMRLFRNSVAPIPETRRNRLIEVSRTIGSVALEKSECTNIHDYIDLLKLEAQCTAELVYQTVSDRVMVQAGYENFATWCTNAITFGTFADCTRDLRSDVSNGLTSVDPTLRNGGELALEAIRAARTLIHTRVGRNASIAGLAARVKFSKLPTKVTMKRA